MRRECVPFTHNHIVTLNDADIVFHSVAQQLCGQVDM